MTSICSKPRLIKSGSLLMLALFSSTGHGQTVALNNTYGFANQDKNSGLVRVQSNGTLFLKGNRWQATQQTYKVTPNTILEFEFRTNNIGEIHGIGLEDDNYVTEQQFISLAGTQNWGQRNLARYTAAEGQLQKFSIAVGKVFTGNNVRLVFVNDNDIANPVNTSFFRNVTLRENTDTPPPPVTSTCMSDLQKELLTAHNRARKTGRQCGDRFMAAAPTLKWSCKLAKAAVSHSADMANNNFFSHTGSDGLSPFDRISNTGYSYRSAGENIAAGYTSVQSVVDGWLTSPGHCRNIMNPGFTHFGGALKQNSDSSYRRYWTGSFARPY